MKTGERQEWDDKKKKMVTKDVYGNKTEPVRVRLIDGRQDQWVGVHPAPAAPAVWGTGRCRPLLTATAGFDTQDQFFQFVATMPTTWTAMAGS